MVDNLQTDIYSCDLARKTCGSCGYDIILVEKDLILAKQLSVIKTHVQLNVPSGYIGKIEARSSLSVKGLYIMPTTLYEGSYNSISIICLSLFDDIFVACGSAFAQLIIIPTR